MVFQLTLSCGEVCFGWETGDGLCDGFRLVHFHIARIWRFGSSGGHVIRNDLTLRICVVFAK